MWFAKRAWYYLLEYRRKNSVIFLIFLFVSVLLLGAWSMKDAARKAAQNMGDSLGAVVTIYKKDGGIVSYDKESFFPLACARKMEELKGVEEAVYLTEVNVFGEDVEGIIPDYELRQKDSDNFYTSEAEKNAGALNLIGVAETDTQPRFTYMGDEVLEGRGIKPEDWAKPYAVVSQRFLTHNHLEIGDTFEVSSCFDRGRKTTLTVVGVHSGNYSGTKSWYSDCNDIYVPLKKAWEMNESGIMRAEYHIKDASHMESLIEQMKEAGEIYGIEFMILRNNLEYLNAINSLQGVQKVCDGMWTSIAVVMALILALLGFFSAIERMNEAGILISLGESRIKIWIQMFLEQIIPVLSGAAIGIGIWFFIDEMAGKWILGTAEIWEGAVFSITWESCVFLVGTCIGISMLSLGIGALVLCFYQPKEMLQETKRR